MVLNRSGNLVTVWDFDPKVVWQVRRAIRELLCRTTVDHLVAEIPPYKMGFRTLAISKWVARGALAGVEFAELDLASAPLDVEDEFAHVGQRILGARIV